MIKIRTSEIKDILRFFFRKRGAPVPFLHGKPGVSKSAQVKHLCKEFGFAMRDVRLAQMSAMDVRGLPVIDHTKKVTEWFPPNFLPIMESIQQMKEQGYKGLVLFFDELSSAVPAIQAAAYQILLDRASGDYVIPDIEDFPIHMVAAGNNLRDGAVVQNMSTALKNRLAHYQVEVDADGFITYGLNNNMDPRVISYIKSFPQNLHVMPAKNDPSVYAFPTNRSWEFVSNMIKDETYSDTLHTLVAGVIGEAAAQEFSVHMQLADQLPDVDSVIERGVRANLNQNEVALVWAYVMSLCSKMIGKSTDVKDYQITNFISALRDLKPEFMYLALNEIIHMDNKKVLNQRYAPNPEWTKAVRERLKVITGL